jgi:hypothetical protein
MITMAPRRRQQKAPLSTTDELPCIEVILPSDSSSSTQASQLDPLVDPQLLELDPLLQPTPQSSPQLSATEAAEPITQPQSIPSDREDRIEWTLEMVNTLFTELLDQALDGKRSDSGFKKEAWDTVRESVQLVYSGPYTIPVTKIKQKEQLFKGYYKDWKFLRDQSGFGWDEETRMITASNQVWDTLLAVSTILYILLVS